MQRRVVKSPTRTRPEACLGLPKATGQGETCQGKFNQIFDGPHVCFPACMDTFDTVWILESMCTKLLLLLLFFGINMTVVQSSFPPENNSSNKSLQAQYCHQIYDDCIKNV